ncbi:ankyrin repeat protein [Elysia marginata]|uniref:Ankyrin repeat protein n=1 Tax=Elysia marginata TaxID=1093978 RepID=A0AAV4HE38_9GAST|nr:ankyrin repeat protein [Elysia marginata]
MCFFLSFSNIFFRSTIDDLLLTDAIERQDLPELKRILAKGRTAINGDSFKHRCDPPVIMCMRSHGGRNTDKDDAMKCEILKLLLKYGADLNTQSRSVNFSPAGATAAAISATYGYVRCLRHLVEAGADLSIPAKGGTTALMLAITKGQIHCAEYIIQHVSTSCLNLQSSSGNTALMLAASCTKDASFLCLQSLLRAGADLDIENSAGCTALMVAVGSKNLRAVRLLLLRGALFDTLCHKGESPVMIALRLEFGEALTLLLHKGASVNTISQLGFTPMSEASNPDHAIQLLRHGLDPALSRRDRRIFHYAVDFGLRPLVRGFLMNGFPPLDLGIEYKLANRRNKCKVMSPLSIAMINRRVDLAKFLIANRFLTGYDTVQLCWDSELLGHLKHHSASKIVLSGTPASEAADVLAERVLWAGKEVSTPAIA